MFMGTPHMGSDLAQWGSTLARFSDLFRRTNTQITDVLQPGSEMLATLQQEFHLLLNARSREEKKLEIFCFYEEVPVLGVGLVSLWLKLCEQRRLCRLGYMSLLILASSHIFSDSHLIPSTSRLTIISSHIYYFSHKYHPVLSPFKLTSSIPQALWHVPWMRRHTPT